MFKEKTKTIASTIAPNPLETTYWADLTEDPSGNVLKTYQNGEWLPLGDEKNKQQDDEISALKDRCTSLENNKLDKTTYNAFVQEANQIHNELESSKADKATTLAGYGITDAYTKNETDSRINTAVSNLVNQAPETLDTLDELAQALGDDPNFATTVSNLIGTKANSADVYTKAQCDSKIDEKIEAINAVSSTTVTSVQVVTELPEQQGNDILCVVDGILYIKVTTTQTT